MVPFLMIGLVTCHLAFTARTSAIMCKSGLFRPPERLKRSDALGESSLCRLD